jgi:hypothetical protein
VTVTVTELLLIELELSRHSFAENSYSKFCENPTNDLFGDSHRQTDRQAFGRGLHKERAVLPSKKLKPVGNAVSGNKRCLC